MILAYAARLTVLAFAVFFLLNGLIGLLMRAAAPLVIRQAERMRPEGATRLLFVLRLLPAVLATAVVLGMCVPAYLWLEPKELIEEHAGWSVLLLAALGAGLWLDAMVRAVRAWTRSARLTSECVRRAKTIQPSGVPGDVLVMDGAAPVLALVGVLHPRIVVSTRVLDELAPEQLQAALD